MPRNTIRNITWAAILTTPVTVSGCFTYQPPRFDVVAVEELERSDEAVVLGFTLSAANPNDEPMPLWQARYSLTLDDATVFSGRRSAEATLRQFGTQTITLPAVVPADAFDLARFDAPTDIRYALTGVIQYQTPGELAEVLFDTGVRRPDATLDERGTLALTGSTASVMPAESP